MRLIGHLGSEGSARTFGDYLYAQGIENQIEHDQPEGWGIWVSDEGKLKEAGELLTAYRENPAAQKYQDEAKKAAALRAAKEAEQAAYLKKVQSRRNLFRPLRSYGVGPLTFALIAASVTVFILSKMGEDARPIMGLFISTVATTGNPTLPEIRHGELWRLFTPIFIHFGLIHILFNMLWLRDLGSMIEGRQSSFHLAALVVVIAACSNLAQVYIGHSPVFGGMSGVVYGLLGYIWIRGRFDPGSGLFLHQSTVMMMLIWFFACLVGIIPHVANAAHGAGLVLGMVWGFLSSQRLR